MLPNWGFRNTVHAYHAENSVQLPLKPLGENPTGSSDSKVGTVSLDKFASMRVPEIKDGAKYNLKPYLFNGTLQTLYTFKADFSKQYKVYFGREIVSISKDDVLKSKQTGQYAHLHAGDFTLDYVVDPNDDELDPEFFKEKCAQTLPDGYPRLHPRCRYYTEDELGSIKEKWLNDENPISIIIPGLAGGIQEAPIRATCYTLHKQGHHVVVLNQRGCSRSKITTPYLYTGLDTDDIKFILNKFHDLYSKNIKRQFHAIAYSFGGLQLTNYLIKEGKDSKLTSAITVSAPWDLNESMAHISRSVSGHYFFEPAVSFFLLTLVKNNMKVLSQAPEIFTQEKYDALKKRIKNPTDFDDEFTSKLVGMLSSKQYYYAASAAIQIYKIRTPLLVINSSDDPMISTDYPKSDIKQHPWIYMATSDLGGHYSFIKSDGHFWFNDVIANWINSWREIDVQTPHDIIDNDWHLETNFRLEYS